MTGQVPPTLSAVIAGVQGKTSYSHSSWGIRVADLQSGEVLIEQASDTAFVPGSIMKVYSTAAALDAYGPDFRFHTPVYRLGSVSEGTLRGNLVLVASGDFNFGLRDQPDGTLGFNNLPQLDHNYADTGFPGGALVAHSNPLRGLDSLAKQVRAAGIRVVRGNVAVDDRLFTTNTSWPDGVITPIWVNENVIDITVTPKGAGETAAVEWRPRTAAVRVVSEVMTVAGAASPLALDSPGTGTVRVRGQIAAGSPPTLAIWQIQEPAAFARTAFIEALRRAGVRVTAAETGPNPTKLLPESRSYPMSQRVAEYVSVPLAQFIKVILKVSYNRGADLMVCLVAAKAGSQDCATGIGRQLELMSRLGVSKTGTIVFDGAGSVDSGRTTPADQTVFLGNVTRESWGAFIRDSMAILGVDGTQAANGVGTPAAGRVRVKDGSRAAMGPGEFQGILVAKTQVGYIDAASGRQLVYAIFLNGAPFRGFDDFLAADHDVAAITAAIQGAY